MVYLSFTLPSVLCLVYAKKCVITRCTKYILVNFFTDETIGVYELRISFRTASYASKKRDTVDGAKILYILRVYNKLSVLLDHFPHALSF